MSLWKTVEWAFLCNFPVLLPFCQLFWNNLTFLCYVYAALQLTSITNMSLELCCWTLGCWTLTATVLPSCSTALWTWAKEAAPWGVSSKKANNSDSWKTIVGMKGERVNEGIILWKWGVQSLSIDGNPNEEGRWRHLPLSQVIFICIAFTNESSHAPTWETGDPPMIQTPNYRSYLKERRHLKIKTQVWQKHIQYTVIFLCHCQKIYQFQCASIQKSKYPKVAWSARAFHSSRC